MSASDATTPLADAFGRMHTNDEKVDEKERWQTFRIRKEKEREAKRKEDAEKAEVLAVALAPLAGTKKPATTTYVGKGRPQEERFWSVYSKIDDVEKELLAWSFAEPPCSLEKVSGMACVAKVMARHVSEEAYKAATGCERMDELKADFKSAQPLGDNIWKNRDMLIGLAEKYGFLSGTWFVSLSFGSSPYDATYSLAWHNVATDAARGRLPFGILNVFTDGRLTERRGGQLWLTIGFQVADFRDEANRKDELEIYLRTIRQGTIRFSTSLTGNARCKPDLFTDGGLFRNAHAKKAIKDDVGFFYVR